MCEHLHLWCLHTYVPSVRQAFCPSVLLWIEVGSKKMGRRERTLATFSLRKKLSSDFGTIFNMRRVPQSIPLLQLWDWGSTVLDAENFPNVAQDTIALCIVCRCTVYALEKSWKDTTAALDWNALSGIRFVETWILPRDSNIRYSIPNCHLQNIQEH